MSVFYLFPIYWFTGMMLYASSPRQKFLTQNQFKPPRWLALCAVLMALIITVTTLSYLQLSFIISLIFALAAAILFIPAPFLLLRHKPKWALTSLVAITVLSGIFQLIGDQ